MKINYLTISFLAAIFIAVLSFYLLGKGLNRDPYSLPSPLLNKSFPADNIPIFNSNKSFGRKDFIDQVSFLHVWATWCSSCQEEAKGLLEIRKEHPKLQFIGLSYKDDRANLKQWYSRYPNLFDIILPDTEGKLAIDLGVYGTPESFVIDKKGVIRYKYVGPIDRRIWDEKVYPEIKKLL